MGFFYWILLWPLLFVPKPKPGAGAPGVAILAIAGGWLLLILAVIAGFLIKRYA